MEGFRRSSEATQLESGSLGPASSDERRRQDPFQAEGGFQPVLPPSLGQARQVSRAGRGSLPTVSQDPR